MNAGPLSRRCGWSLVVAIATLLLVSGCGDGTTEPGGVEPITKLPRELSAAEQEVIQANNIFAFDLLAELNEEDPSSNLFISPLSASMALGMTLNGAVGTTFEAMRSTLGFGELDQTAINESYRDLIALLLNLDPSVSFGLGNSIWYRQGFPVEAAFLAATHDYFDAEVAALDFSDPASADVINDWVAEKTNDKIDEIVQAPIDPLIVMFLINAIYFNGTWTYEFDPAATEMAPFHRKDGSTGQVMMMVQEADLFYRGTELYQAVDLPYGGGAFAMTIVLPQQGVDLDMLVAELDAESWANMIADLEETGLRLFLPRFKLEYEKVLNAALKALGMEVAFDDRAADFSGIAPDAELYISQVKQKSFVEVDEEGTEAAAATVVVVTVESANSGPPELRVDRPFLFAIRERLSGTLLFVGKVVGLPAS
jgi:serine protease inhibitor